MTRKLILTVGTAVLLAACAPQPPTMVPPLPPTAAPETQAATATPTPGHLPFVDWLAYHDDVGGFTIQHPLTWQRRDNGDYPVEFYLPAAEGTTLLEKYLQIDVTPQAAECRQMRYGTDTMSSSNVSVNGIDFLKETGAGLGAGNVYEWTAYSTMKDSTCITLIFVLHSANPGVYATEPPPFDAAAESQVFDQMLGTFNFDP